MSVTAAEIKIYGSLAMEETNTGTQGGGIDTTTRIIPDSESLWDSLSGSVDISSSSTSDTTQTVTITGRNTAGSFITETLTLNGTTIVTGSNTYNRLEKIVISATCIGSITCIKHGGATIVTIEPGVKQIRRPFYNISSNAVGGGPISFYEKVFVKNTDSTNALLSANISIPSIPSELTFGLASAVNDSGTATTRITAPSGITFGTAAVNVPGTDLQPAAAIGLWLCCTLAEAAAPAVTSFIIQTAGSTT